MDSTRAMRSRRTDRTSLPLQIVAAVIGALLCPLGAQSQVLRDGLWITNGKVNSVLVAGDALYLGGEFTRVGPATGGGVIVDNLTGQLRAPSPLVVGKVNASVPDGSGGWYIGGAFTAVQGQPRSNLAHLDATGHVTGWSPSANADVMSWPCPGSPDTLLG